MKSFFFAVASVLALAACESNSLVNAPVVHSNVIGNRRAEIINETDIAIARLRVQNADTLTWSGNILSGKIRKNSSQIVLIDDGSGQCLYNFKVTMENGQSLTRRGMDVCRLAAWTIFRGG